MLLTILVVVVIYWFLAAFICLALINPAYNDDGRIAGIIAGAPVILIILIIKGIIWLAARALDEIIDLF